MPHLTRHTVNARHGITLMAAVLVGGLVAGLPSAAYAGRWTGSEPAGDVIGYSFDPEPAPCGTLTVVPRPGNRSTDIRRLSVRHTRKDVTIRLRVPGLEVTSGLVASVYIHTDRHPDQGYFLSVDHFEGTTEGFLSGEPAWPALRTATGGGRVLGAPTSHDRSIRWRAADDDCGSFFFGGGQRPCRYLKTWMRERAGVIGATMPRACVGAPRWVRVAAGLNRYDAATDSWLADDWHPADRRPRPWTGPFGGRAWAPR